MNDRTETKEKRGVDRLSVIHVVYVTNVTAASIVLLLLYALYRGGFTRGRATRIYSGLLVINLIQTVVYTLKYYFESNGFFGDAMLAHVISSSTFSVNAAFELYWVCYLESRLHSDWSRFSKRTVLLSIPAVLMFISAGVNLFTPVFYYLDESLHYFRTEAFFISNIPPVFYFVYGIVLAQRLNRKNHEYGFFPVLLFLLPILVALIAEGSIYGLCLIPLSCSISLMSVYLTTQQNLVNIDPLSKLYTRSQLVHFVESELSILQRGNGIVGVMIDMDDFKIINDCFGHLMGDEAIFQMGLFIRQCDDGSKTLHGFRYAGDEFAVLLEGGKTEAEFFINRLNEKVEQWNQRENGTYRLAFSYGMTMLDRKRDSVDSFLGRMDELMYQQKKEKKASR